MRARCCWRPIHPVRWRIPSQRQEASATLLDEGGCGTAFRCRAARIAGDLLDRKVVVSVRNDHAHGRAGIDTALDAYRAAMQADELADQGQANASTLKRAATLPFDAMEALEDTRNLLLRNANT